MGAKIAAFLTWLGTALGAVGVLLSLTFAPPTFASRHHAIYLLLVVVVIVLLAITVLVPLPYVIGWARFRLMIWRAARKHPPRALVGILAIPGSETGNRSIIFTTDTQSRRLITTAARPAGLRFTVPFEANVWAGSLPYNVRRYGKTIFRVDQFLPGGFVIGDQSPGLAVEGEVSYSDVVPFRPTEPPSAEPSSER